MHYGHRAQVIPSFVFHFLSSALLRIQYQILLNSLWSSNNSPGKNTAWETRNRLYSAGNVTQLTMV